MSELVTKSNKKHQKIKNRYDFSYQAFVKIVVPEAGIEPARYRYRWILSPVRLPVSPLGQRVYYIPKVLKDNIYYLFR